MNKLHVTIIETASSFELEIESSAEVAAFETAILSHLAARLVARSRHTTIMEKIREIAAEDTFDDTIINPPSHDDIREACQKILKEMKS